MSLKADVVGVLLSDDMWSQPHFGLDGKVICGCDLRAVGAAVNSGRIGVRKYTPGPNDPSAFYGVGNNTFYFKYDRITSITQKGLVVHEAVHAALDMNKAAQLKVLDSEGIGYVHQCFYLYPHAPAGARMMSEDATNDKTWAAAWAIAKTMHGGGKASTTQIQALRSAIKVHKNYKDEWRDLAEFDGVA